MAEVTPAGYLSLSDGAILGPSNGEPEGAICLVRRASNGPRLEARLALPGSVRARLYAIAAECGVDIGYPVAVLREVRACQRSQPVADPDLEDLTRIPFVTIDDITSRDLDQALYVESRPRGGFRVRYALADASHYVRPGSALFTEALRRGVSYYLPGISFPMLPPALSEDLVSLNPRVERRAVVMTLDLDAAGLCTHSRLSRARIRSVAKLSFSGVQEYYDHPDSSPLAATPYRPVLDGLRAVGERRLADARARDVVAYQRTQVAVHWGDAEGMAFNLIGDRRNDTERYNEQISLLCNVEGARLMREAGGPALWRVHPAPPEARLEFLHEVVQGMSRLHGLPLFWTPRHRPGGRPVADLLAAVAALDDEPIQRAIERTAMVSNVRSVFSAEHGPHHGVGATGYARFSAPMREVVGIYSHGVTLHNMGIGSWTGAPSAELRDEVVEAGNQGQDRQRELTKHANKLVLDHFFARDLAQSLDSRPWHAGVVVELRRTRAYLVLDDPPVEVKIYVEDLGQPRLAEGGAQLQLLNGPITALSLGEEVEVRVLRQERDQWRFDIRHRRGRRQPRPRR